MQYQIRYTEKVPAHDGQFDAAPWTRADTHQITQFFASSEEPFPTTQFRMLYTQTDLHLIFHVHDSCVSSLCTELHDNVCRDSCVEFFVEPMPGAGYFNFEINAGGTLLLFYILDPSKKKPGDPYALRNKIPQEQVDTFDIYHSMPRVVDPPITQWTDWVIQLRVPFDFFRGYIPQLPDPAGETWRANLYKCGSPRSHWACWAPMDERPPNFHRPEFFAPIHFLPGESQNVVAATGEESAN